MIEVRDLVKTFDGFAALRGATLTVPKGAVYGLVGPNGAGKSTLLRHITGVFRQDSGEVLVNGVPVYENRHVKENIVSIPDDWFYYNQSTIREMAALYAGLYPRFDWERFERLRELFQLPEKKTIRRMSKGMQRQAALINAIASSPDYLLLDEAFDGLDVVIRKALKGILVDGVTARGMTTVIASHNLRELEDLCDSVGLVHNGHMVLSDEVDKLKGNLHKVQAAFRGVPDVTAFSGLDVIKAERSGSLLQLIVRGDEIQIMNYINRLSPVFSECIEPSLEETFMFELEVNGYDVKSIAE